MANGFSRKAMTTVLVSSLLLSAGGAAVSAAPKEDKKDSGRTEQKVQTGVISFNKLDVPRYAKEVTLSGTVVIDGPQLVLSISGVESEDIKITKSGDKTWMYEALVDVESLKGNANFEISAETIYANGKNAGTVHTSAPTETQEIHVPYIVSTVAENTKWTAYDRLENEFTLSYNEVENWSKGDSVVTLKWTDVSGTEDEVTVLGTTVDVPTAIQYFTFADKPDWEFDDSTKTYSAIFDVFITDSKGHVSTESVTKTGLTPGEVHTISHKVTDKFGEITKTVEYTAPEAPVVVLIPEKVENLVLTLLDQNDNQYKLSASYTVFYTNGTTAEITSELNGNIKKPNKGSETKDFKIEGFVYTVTVKYNPKTGKDEASAVLKK